MTRAGCNVVLHTFSENDLRFYSGTMEEIVSLSKEHGLEVYLDPWGVGGIFGGEAFTQFALEHGDARQVLSDGSLAPAACPNHPGFREFMRDWIRAAVQAGVDVIFLDEPHFWDPHLQGWAKDVWSCRCTSCQKEFQEVFHAPLPEKLTPQVREFQDISMRSFLKELAQGAQAGGTKVALCLLPDWEGKERVVERWARFASIEAVDIFGTDPYWMWAGRTFSDYEYFVRATVKLAERYDKEPQIWVQACKVRAGEEEFVRRSVETAWDLGVRNIMAWSFLGTPYMTWVRSARPEVVWKELSAAYLAIRKRESRGLA
jgi:hypothetical protein